jgi:hypothetical protein
MAPSISTLTSDSPTRRARSGVSGVPPAMLRGFRCLGDLHIAVVHAAIRATTGTAKSAHLHPVEDLVGELAHLGGRRFSTASCRCEQIRTLLSCDGPARLCKPGVGVQVRGGTCALTTRLALVELV